MSSQKSETQDLQETTRSISTTDRPDVLTRYRAGSAHPHWLGDSPRLQFPPGTMFGYLRLLSDELVRVSRTRHSGKRAGHTCTDLHARCVCTRCGTEVLVQKSNLIHGKTIQCKHCNVMAGHATVTRRLWGGRLPDSTDKWIKSRWDAIRYRCYDPTSKYYARYGGRGIKLSDEFLDPRVFVSYVKELPDARPDMQIDRIDNSKGYERGNLRWVSARENCNNRRCPCASRTTASRFLSVCSLRSIQRCHTSTQENYTGTVYRCQKTVCQGSVT